MFSRLQLVPKSCAQRFRFRQTYSHRHYPILAQRQKQQFYSLVQPIVPIASRPRRQEILKGGFSCLSITAVLGCLVVGSLLFHLVPGRLEELSIPAQSDVEEIPANQRPQENHSLARKGVKSTESRIMSGGALPGRSGNLTSDQEAKLRELWSATLGILGVTSDGLADADGDASLAESDQNSTVDSVASDKKKKRHLGIFGKKHGTANGVNNESKSSNGASASEADDKYGQTKAFKNAVASESPEDLREAFWGVVKHDHPDSLLLRFLRARKWDVEKALVMMVSTLHWRLREMHVDDEIVRRGEGGALEDTKSSDSTTRKQGDDFLAQLRMGKSFLHGIDKEGRPMAVVRVRYHRQGEQSESSTEKFTVYVIETARLFLAPPVDTAAVIFDMTGFSMANMDYAPVKFMIKCFEANYPESLGVVLVHKAPWVFQGIWSIIKGWLDPVVAGKVHFTRNVEDLEEFIPRSRIIKELGGDEDWTYEYVEPNPTENDLMKDKSTKKQLLVERAKTVRTFENATLSWISAAAERRDLATLRSQRNDLAEKLRVEYWSLDPYVRARTIYDRTGCIKGPGHVDFYPGAAGGKDASKTPSYKPETSEDDLD